jgi:hypothetical protein
MSRVAVGRMLDRWISEPGFREAMRRDPAWAIRQAGLALSDEELAAAKGVDWSLAERQLLVCEPPLTPELREGSLAAVVGVDQTLDRAESILDDVAHLLKHQPLRLA